MFAVVGGMLCKSDKPSIIIIIITLGVRTVRGWGRQGGGPVRDVEA